MKGWVWCEDIDESATDTGDLFMGTALDRTMETQVEAK